MKQWPTFDKFGNHEIILKNDLPKFGKRAGGELSGRTYRVLRLLLCCESKLLIMDLGQTLR